MDGLTSGLRKLRFSLLPLIFSQISLALSGVSETLLGHTLNLPFIVSSAALATLAYALALRGLSNVCSTLSGIFCMLKRLVKYLLPITVLLTVAGIYYTHEEFQNLGLGLDSLLGRPILLLIAILFVLLGILMAYSFFKLGSLTESGSMRLGAILLVPSHLLSLAGYPVYGSAMGIAASLILMLSLTRLIRTGVEVVEEVPEGYEEEVEEASPRPREVPREEGEFPLEGEAIERIPPKPKERRAKLLGPNGLTIELELGIRMFGRRDFVGYVPEEDLDYISRRHFEIKGTGAGFFIRDLGSLNGTWVNGNRLKRGDYVKLTNGSVIDVAEVVRLRFSLEAEDLGVPGI